MDTIAEWLDYLTRRGRSPETIRTYRSVITDYVATVTDPLTCIREDAEAWWETHADQAAKTRRRTLSIVRSFYQWAARFDHRPDDPTRRIDPPPEGRRLPSPIGRSDMRKLLDHAPPDLRRAIALGGYAGLRVSEAAALHWRDVDQEAMRIYVRAGKGDKDRAVGLSPLLLDELLPDTGGNVVTGGSADSAGTLQRRVNRFIKAQGVDATFHKLRSRYATVALAKGAPLLSVSRSMGHAAVTVTAVYALSPDSDLDLIANLVAE